MGINSWLFAPVGLHIGVIAEEEADMTIKYLRALNIADDFTLAVGQPINEEKLDAYLHAKSQPVQLLVEDHDENNDYNCKLGTPVVFVKLGPQGIIDHMYLSLT